MKRILLLLVWLNSPLTTNAEGYTSILKRTKDTVNKIEIRNQDQCDKDYEIFSEISGMRRDICDYKD